MEVITFDIVANTLAKSLICRSLGRLDHGPSSQTNIVSPSGRCFVEGFMLAHVYFHARRVERSVSSKQVLVWLRLAKSVQTAISCSSAIRPL